MLPLNAREKLLGFLDEDWGKGDVTGELIQEKTSTAAVYAKEPCLLAGVEEAAFLFEHEGIHVRASAEDGLFLKKPALVLSLKGSNKKIFAVTRTALNVLGRMSGVGTACFNARKAVEAVSPKTRVALTRKTLPGFAFFDKKAAVLAGVDSHRLDLSGMVLLKDQHVSFFAGVGKAVWTARKKASFSSRIEVEVTSEREALDAAKTAPDAIMLDNFPLEKTRRTMRLLREKGFSGLIELSGGIKQENLRALALLKPDVISMGSLTQACRSIEFSLKFG